MLQGKQTLGYKVQNTCFIEKKDIGRHFYGNKRFLLYFSPSKFKLQKRYGHTLGGICTSNQAEILTALNHCLVSSVIVTEKSLNYTKPYVHLVARYSRTKITLQLFFFNTVCKAGLKIACRTGTIFCVFQGNKDEIEREARVACERRIAKKSLTF